MSLTTLFLDFNSYFASVEQQLTPELRGKPIVVVPMLVGSGCCIAASIEAKRFGVRTGQTLDEARERCPHVIPVKARHREYVRMHHRLLEAIEKCIPVEQIHSVDEVSCRLARGEREVEQAVALAGRIKAQIAADVGSSMRCSIGLATNRMLAKLATDMQKPDGLVVIRREDLPGKLHGLQLTDFAGIGKKMEARLHAAGIRDVERLCASSVLELERAWGGVLGRHWWLWLRGEETTRSARKHRSMGHQHVLGPKLRNEEGAWGIAVRLLTRAAARMRSLGYWATGMHLVVKFQGRGGTSGKGEEWDCWVHLSGGESGTQDGLEMLRALQGMWKQKPRGVPRFVGVTLTELVHEQCVTKPLFGEQQRRVELSNVIDRINCRFGADAVGPASLAMVKSVRTGGIAFASVPRVEELPAAEETE